MLLRPLADVPLPPFSWRCAEGISAGPVVKVHEIRADACQD